MPEDEPARKAARQVAEAQKTVAQKVLVAKVVVRLLLGIQR